MKNPAVERMCRSIVRCGSVLGVLAMSLLMMISSSEVLAQDQPLRPPTTKEDPSAPKFIVIAVAFLLVGLVVVVATLKSKRGHQD